MKFCEKIYGFFISPGTCLEENTNMMDIPAIISPYFKENIVANYNNDDQITFIKYRNTSSEENLRRFSEWKNLGIPDVLLGQVNLMKIFGTEVSYDEYSLVYFGVSNFYWKGTSSMEYSPIYVRTELLSQYNLKSLPYNKDTYMLFKNIPKDVWMALKQGDISMDKIMDVS